MWYVELMRRRAKFLQNSDWIWVTKGGLKNFPALDTLCCGLSIHSVLRPKCVKTTHTHTHTSAQIRTCSREKTKKHLYTWVMPVLQHLFLWDFSSLVFLSDGNTNESWGLGWIFCLEWTCRVLQNKSIDHHWNLTFTLMFSSSNQWLIITLFPKKNQAQTK